jgi:hypothetical protein
MSDAIVRIGNESSRDIFISGDPNWDDQILILNGRPKAQPFRLPPGHSAELFVPAEDNGEIGAHALGVIVADGRDVDYGSAGGYQTTIGRQQETGWLGITDESVLNAPAVRYSTTREGPLSMKMDFVDIEPPEAGHNRSLRF